MAWLTIIGGGLAGLSLCDAILKIYEQSGQSLPGSIVIFEKRPFYTDDRSYCFFGATPSSPNEYQHYSEWEFSCKNSSKKIVHRGGSVCYHRLRGIDVVSDLLERNNAHAQVTINTGCDVSPRDINGLVVDTRPAPASDFRIKQSFLGREVNILNRNTPQQAVLMGNMRLEAGNFTFDYLLPIGDDKVLLEVTQFSSEVPSKSTLDGLWSKAAADYAIDTDNIIREEFAVLPMGLKCINKNALHSQQIRWGTGYGYLETKRWAKACAESIVFNERPAYPADRTCINRFDTALLRVIEKQPNKLPDIFMSMAANLSAEQFSRFMATPRLVDLMSVMSAVPKRPFLRALYDG